MTSSLGLYQPSIPSSPVTLSSPSQIPFHAFHHSLNLFSARDCRCRPFRHRLRCSASAPVVVLEDDKYGKKEVISLTPDLYRYVLSNVREPEVLRELREETASMRGSQMQVSPDQAQFLAMLVQILGAQKCIEIGVYTGYSSLAVALVLPESGQLVACERDEKCIQVAQKYYKHAGISHKVTVKKGLAVDALKSMILNGEAGSYDFAFIDAEKRMYNEYFELLLQLVRVGGVIVIDNVLWHGKVADPLVNDTKTICLRNFNKKLFEDMRISISMVPIGDGMTICRKIYPSEHMNFQQSRRKLSNSRNGDLTWS